MGALTDFFIAAPENAEDIATQWDSHEEFPKIDAKDTDPMRLAALEHLLTKADFEKVYELNEANFRWIVVPDESEEDEEEYKPDRQIMLYELSTNLVEALAALNFELLQRYAILWADNEEWQLNNVTPAELVPLLKDLSALASCALKEGKNMYLRVVL